MSKKGTPRQPNTRKKITRKNNETNIFSTRFPQFAFSGPRVHLCLVVATSPQTPYFLISFRFSLEIFENSITEREPRFFQAATWTPGGRNFPNFLGQLILAPREIVQNNSHRPKGQRPDASTPKCEGRNWRHNVWKTQRVALRSVRVVLDTFHNRKNQ